MGVDRLECAPGLIDRDDRVGSGVEDGREAGFDSRVAWSAIAGTASRFAQLLLGPLALGDVAPGHRGAHDLAVAIPDRRNRQRHRDTLSVLAETLRLELLDMLAARQHGHDLGPFVDAVFRDEHLDRSAHGLVAAVPVKPLGASVPGSDGPVEILAEDRVRGTLDHGGEAPDDRVRGLLALGDVHEGDHDAVDAVVQGAVGHDPPNVPAAVLGAHFLFARRQVAQELLGLAQQVVVGEPLDDVADRPADDPWRSG